MRFKIRSLLEAAVVLYLVKNDKCIIKRYNYSVCLKKMA